jgi:histidine triad (HIT) family protein
MADGCIFCRIATGEIPVELLYRDEEVVAFRDVNPQAPTHVLLVPVRHYPTLREVPGDAAGVLAKLLQVAGTLADSLGIAESGFRVVVNSGPAAGQTVPHLHCHLLGGRELGWPPG